MAVNKRYYWLKLKEDFFDDDTIQFIEDQQNGKEYCLFYLKLCLKSLKKDGILVRRVGEILIPYDVKKLSEVTRTNVDTVKAAMKLFKDIGLIQVLENGELYLTQLKNMIGSETKDAIRKRKERERIQGVDNVHILSENCPPEKEIEKDKDIDKELNTDIENKEVKTSTKKHSRNFVKPSVEEIMNYCNERGNNIDPQSFYDFYESKGWYVGKNKMKDWKAAVRTWERNNTNGFQNGCNNRGSRQSVQEKLDNDYDMMKNWANSEHREEFTYPSYDPNDIEF